MIWIAEDPSTTTDTSIPSSRKTDELNPQPTQQDKAVPEPPGVDVDALCARIGQLNSVAGDGTMKIASKTEGSMVHVLKRAEGIPFTIFRDGIMLRRGPFR